ncbi:MAG: hypothetical protein PSX80_09285 [bacterium]|nr:hypothetical protein [bacterium]
MRLLSESRAIERLAEIRDEFRSDIRARFEHRAKPCSDCQTPGICCSDEHFVNVRVSRIEAAAIRKAVVRLADEVRSQVFDRLEKVDADAEFYSCPIYQPGTGCLIHKTAKPLPCIAHACYERKEDLPPDELLATRELEIEDLNRRVYGRSQPMTPIHAALR